MNNIPVEVALRGLDTGYSRYIPPPPTKPRSDIGHIVDRDYKIQIMKLEEKAKWETYQSQQQQQLKLAQSLNTNSSISGGGCKHVPGSVRTPVPGSVRTPVPGLVRTPVPGSVRTPVPGSVRTPVPGSVRTPVPGSVRTPVPGSVLQLPNGENFIINEELIKEIKSQLNVGEKNAKFASAFISKINSALLPPSKPRKDGKGRDRGQGTITRLLELIPGVKSIIIKNNNSYYL